MPASLWEETIWKKKKTLIFMVMAEMFVLYE